MPMQQILLGAGAGGTKYTRFYINKANHAYKLDYTGSHAGGSSNGPFSGGTLASADSPGYSMSGSGSNEVFKCGWGFGTSGSTVQSFKITHSGANRKLWLIGVGHGAQCGGTGNNTRAMDLLVINSSTTSGSTIYHESGLWDIGTDTNANYSMKTMWLGSSSASSPAIGTLEDIHTESTVNGISTGTKGVQLWTNNTYSVGWHWQSGYSPNLNGMTGTFYQGVNGTHYSDWNTTLYSGPSETGLYLTYYAYQPTLAANSDFPNITTNNGSDQARGQIWSMAFAIDDE